MSPPWACPGGLLASLGVFGALPGFAVSRAGGGLLRLRTESSGELSAGDLILGPSFQSQEGEGGGGPEPASVLPRTQPHTPLPWLEDTPVGPSPASLYAPARLSERPWPASSGASPGSEGGLAHTSALSGWCVLQLGAGAPGGFCFLQWVSCPRPAPHTLGWPWPLLQTKLGLKRSRPGCRSAWLGPGQLPTVESFSVTPPSEPWGLHLLGSSAGPETPYRCPLVAAVTKMTDKCLNMTAIFSVAAAVEHL